MSFIGSLLNVIPKAASAFGDTLSDVQDISQKGAAQGKGFVSTLGEALQRGLFGTPKTRSQAFDAAIELTTGYAKDQQDAAKAAKGGKGGKGIVEYAKDIVLGPYKGPRPSKGFPMLDEPRRVPPRRPNGGIPLIGGPGGSGDTGSLMLYNSDRRIVPYTNKDRGIVPFQSGGRGIVPYRGKQMILPPFMTRPGAQQLVRYDPRQQSQDKKVQSSRPNTYLDMLQKLLGVAKQQFAIEEKEIEKDIKEDKRLTEYQSGPRKPFKGIKYTGGPIVPYKEPQMPSFVKMAAEGQLNEVKRLGGNPYQFESAPLSGAYAGSGLRSQEASQYPEEIGGGKGRFMTMKQAIKYINGKIGLDRYPPASKLRPDEISKLNEAIVMVIRDLLDAGLIDQRVSRSLRKTLKVSSKKSKVKKGKKGKAPKRKKPKRKKPKSKQKKMVFKSI